MSNKVIGWVSCGVTSAVAVKQAILKYGSENMELYYMEISTAYPDNERFLKDLEEWYRIKINRIKSNDYTDQFDVILKTGYVNGPTGARCTLELKKKVRWLLEKKIDYSGQIFGFEFSPKEVNRALRFNEQYPGAKAIFPLIETHLTKNNCAEILRSSGIKLPIMYVLGFENNNCIGCVKGGKWYWNKIRKHLKDLLKFIKNIDGWEAIVNESSSDIFIVTKCLYYRDNLFPYEEYYIEGIMGEKFISIEYLEAKPNSKQTLVIKVKI